MKVYTCNKFKGHNPVGVGAVIVAEDKIEAIDLLEQALTLQGLDQGVCPYQVEELKTDQRAVRMLTTGDY